MHTVKVFIVDDSAFMRQLLKDVLSSSDAIKVIGSASDGYAAINKIKELRPDVVTLDIDMPGIDGLTVLRRITVIISTSRKKNAEMAKAISYGAFDFIIKDVKNINIDNLKHELTDKILQAYKSQNPFPEQEITEKAKPLKKEKSLLSLITPKAEIIIIGTSTGGPKALFEVIPKLPGDMPVPIIIIQHMPLYFTTSLAKRMNEITQIPVKEAEEGDKLESGKVFIAKGDYHLTIDKDKKVRFNQDPPHWAVRPSMSITLFSAIKIYGGKILAVVLTGMGKDGSDGISALKKAGGKCIVQNEATCTVFGMPKAVIDDGNADKIVPLSNISKEIINMLAYWQ